MTCNPKPFEKAYVYDHDRYQKAVGEAIADEPFWSDLARQKHEELERIRENIKKTGL